MGGSGGGASVVRDNTFQVYDNVSYQAGRHLIKAGVEWMYLQYVTDHPAQHLRHLPVFRRPDRLKLRPPTAPGPCSPASCLAILRPPAASLGRAAHGWTSADRLVLCSGPDPGDQYADRQPRTALRNRAAALRHARPDHGSRFLQGSDGPGNFRQRTDRDLRADLLHLRPGRLSEELRLYR